MKALHILLWPWFGPHLTTVTLRAADFADDIKQKPENVTMCLRFVDEDEDIKVVNIGHRRSFRSVQFFSHLYTRFLEVL